MQIGVPAETQQGEARVAATPETVKKLSASGHSVVVEAGAGVRARYPDGDYAAAGAAIATSPAELHARTDLVLKVRAPQSPEIGLMRPGQVLVGMLNRFDRDRIEQLARQGVTAFALEAAPRITRAQSMDVLSSQANIAGYKAVIVAADHYGRLFPMMMTAAGTIKAARVVVMGVGVAGLQAIATARRLGAMVEATDVRLETREQAESLGAKFIEVPLTEAEEALARGADGYARDMGEGYRRRQAALIAERIKQADVVITTALIPGRPAPVLVTDDMVKTMKPGAVIVDMAAEQGGNCPLTERDRVIARHGVTLIGHTNFPSMVATDSSALYARNMLEFLKLIVGSDGRFTLDRNDEIIAACLVCENGQPVARAAD